jgi:hypothetical protein
MREYVMRFEALLLMLIAAAWTEAPGFEVYATSVVRNMKGVRVFPKRQLHPSKVPRGTPA